MDNIERSSFQMHMTSNDPSSSPDELLGSAKASEASENQEGQEEDLSLENLEDISGGLMRKPKTVEPACTTGLMSTCTVKDTLESWCTC